MTNYSILEIAKKTSKTLIPPALAGLDNQYGKILEGEKPTIGEIISKSENNKKTRIKIIAQNEDQEDIIKLILSFIPEKFLKNNFGFKKVEVLNDDNFLAKHNDSQKTIYLSQKIFSKEYNEKRPYHRIKNFPSVVELMIHEIGHSVEQNLHKKNKKLIDPIWHNVTGWVYPEDSKQIIKLKKKGYVSALYNFRNISIEDLETLEDKDVEEIEERIKRRFPMQKPEKVMKISWYGQVSPREDFSESFVRYMLDNNTFRQQEPERFNYFTKYVFNNEGEKND